jgi:hypothetical protein
MFPSATQVINDDLAAPKYTNSYGTGSNIYNAALPKSTSLQPMEPLQTISNTASPTTSPTYDPVAAERARIAAEEAQKAAEEAAKRQQLQGGIKKLIGDTLGIYDSLYGDVRGAAQSQRQLLDQRFDRETGSLSDQFNQELPKIGRAYAGRGAFDSSYRIDAEAGAQKGFQNQVTDLSEQRKADAARIGQGVAEQEAQFGAQQGLLNTVLGRIDETTDVNELTQLRNELDRKMAELTAGRASNMSRDAYTQKFNQLAPASDRLSGLQSTLSQIINGQAPGPLKRAVAQQIIGSAGLPKDQEDQLLAQINSQIA